MILHLTKADLLYIAKDLNQWVVLHHAVHRMDAGKDDVTKRYDHKVGHFFNEHKNDFAFIITSHLKMTHSIEITPCRKLRTV